MRGILQIADRTGKRNGACYHAYDLPVFAVGRGPMPTLLWIAAFSASTRTVFCQIENGRVRWKEDFCLTENDWRAQGGVSVCQKELVAVF